MARASNREKILAGGLRVLHERGYSGASVRDIILAAGVPLGSFTNHFASKEAFSLEVLNIYFERYRETIRETLRNDSLPPLQRLRAYIDILTSSSQENGECHGCLIGNFSVDASEHSEMIRQRLVEIFDEMKQSVAYCLKAAVDAGELRAALDCDEFAGFMIASLQGAFLQAKAERSAAPIERYKRFILDACAL